MKRTLAELLAGALPVVSMLALSMSAQAQERTAPKQTPITILDQNGHRVESGSPSAATQEFGVTVGPGGSFIFSPSTVNIVTGDSVKWTWGSSNHNVRSGNPCAGNGSFCSPSDSNCTTNPLSNVGATYTHTFNSPGTFSYFCSLHCGSGMTGTVVVAAPTASISTVVRDGTGFVITGQTNPNRTVFIQASPNLVTAFSTIGTATANGTGTFSFTDASASAVQSQFYRATLP